VLQGSAADRRQIHALWLKGCVGVDARTSWRAANGTFMVLPSPLRRGRERAGARFAGGPKQPRGCSHQGERSARGVSDSQADGRARSDRPFALRALE